MNIASKIEEKITQATQQQGIVNNGITANFLAEELNVKRNTVSHHLNVLVKNNVLLKVNSRPVIFFDKNILEQNEQVSLESEYDSLAGLQEAIKIKTDVFDKVIGSEGSLYAPIRQLRAAAQYPPNGLPILLTGPTGSGKSFLAQRYFQFCVQAGYISEQRKLITLNCAEYADNPELLSSMLFGYKKGSFTGAEADKPGLLTEANNSMIFLDEVHRLDPKGQEKLFSFLDNQEITPLGETSRSKHVNVRFICATTENINSSFLKTFIRRIPVQVRVPSLRERNRDEREELIISFFQQEAHKIGQTIHLNRQVVDFMDSKSFTSNVGQLKNAVTLSVANALNADKGEKNGVSIKLANLPQTVFSAANNYDEKVTLACNEILTISADRPAYKVAENRPKRDARIICSVIKRCITACDNYLDEEKMRDAVTSEISSLCEQLVYQKKVDRGGMPLGFFKEVLDYELPLLENDYGLKLLGNSIIIFTHYFFNKQYEEPDFNKKELEIIEKMSAHFIPVEDNVVQFVEKLLQTVGLKLDMKVDNVDRLFVYVYLSSIRYEAHKRPIRAIILAHGYSTASSIADVVNKMFGQQVFDAMDMKVNVSVKQIGRELSDYIEQYTIEKGLLLLVDMGSLEGITSFIDKEVDFPIGIIDGVSTQMALDVAEHIQGRKDLESILQDINKLPKPKTKLIYPQGVKKNLIIASCITGIGTADRIKELLKESMPQSKDLIINAYEFEQINQESFMQDIQKIYNVLVIIGTFDPHVDGIPYIPLEDLISGKKIDTLGKVLSSEIPGFKVEKVNQGLMRNFSLERVLNSVTILDVHTIMENVDTFVRSYETLEQNKLSNPVRMAIYVHVSCLLERLIRNTPIDTYAFIDDEQKDIRQTESFKNIKKAFSVIEQIYSVTIPDSEVGYIFDIVNQSANIPA